MAEKSPENFEDQIFLVQMFDSLQWVIFGSENCRQERQLENTGYEKSN
jgi:hypothetical protein